MAVSLEKLNNETIMNSLDSSDVRCGRFTVCERIVSADMMQRPERLDYSRKSARRPYTAAAERIAPAPGSSRSSGIPASSTSRQGSPFRSRKTLARWPWPALSRSCGSGSQCCKHVYSCVDVYSTVDLYSSEQQQQQQQQQQPSQPSSEVDAPSSSPQDGAITLKWWVIDRRQKPVDGDDIADDWNKLFAAWKSVIPRNDYDAKELEWCSSHEPREDEATRRGRPLVGSVSQGDGPDGYLPLLVLGSCRLCGKDHEPYASDASQAAQTAADD
ncbi:hypothetical protein ASPACDRAFT_41106 [Aspergillus aculeatus ATCC 16872]|uniref:Uncharacterized protein n=1 Tax=Aspergillus aculeatus (strain ATCC 16872 / CBS 172.66 / WB 5094) TaxID=690307 RepID=A0A1L9X189_ASPA1|nr:uncharacterized protein ASPACDRAFT_41106 [Aspergillus aculeatus ATCC 16872]OJK02282.1 hypothetical protein ASPACDRAFT_41106 [Aspergillus aculeatus ATCC 16872]